MRPDCGLTLKPKLHAARVFDARHEKTRGRARATPHMSFPDLTDCKILAPQRRRTRSMATSRAMRQPRPRNGKPKWRRANGSTPLRKSPTAAETAPAGCASSPPCKLIPAAPAFGFNGGCNPAFPNAACDASSENLFLILFHLSKTKLHDSEATQWILLAVHTPKRRTCGKKGAPKIGAPFGFWETVRPRFRARRRSVPHPRHL